MQITNELKTGAVELTKVDADNNELKLEGAEFKLLDAAGNEIRTGLTTNAEGKVVVDGLKPGIYKFVETKAPSGYVLDSKEIEFEIVKDQKETLRVKVTNRVEMIINENDDIKLEKLPQTGGTIPLMQWGCILVFIGLFLNRKKS